MPMSAKDEQHRAAVSKAWRNWFLMFLPLLGASLAGFHWFGFGPILILAGLLVVVLFYQRYINRRSWRSIMWGVHARGE